jgi:hypothetical protein
MNDSTPTSEPNTDAHLRRRFARHYRYVWTMRAFGILYILVASVLFFLPDQLFSLINLVPEIFTVGEPIPLPTERFWLVLAVSMVSMLSAISFLAAKSPQIRGYAFVHVLSKVVSVLGFLYVFRNHQPYFAYLVGVITDAPIAVIVAFVTLTRGEIPSQRQTNS